MQLVICDCEELLKFQESNFRLVLICNFTTLQVSQNSSSQCILKKSKKLTNYCANLCGPNRGQCFPIL